MRTAAAAASAGLVAAVTCALVAPAVAATPAVGKPQAKRLCSSPVRHGVLACEALERTDIAAQHTLSPDATPRGLGPADLTGAYHLPTGGGAGTTIAVVDAQDDPNAAKDLATYRSQYGLPACGDGCFRKVDETGGTDYPSPDAGWSGEISLDLDMVSAVAPEAHIILVEAKTAQMSDLGASVNEAVKLGAGYVSNSYGGPEDSSDITADSRYFDHPGTVLTAATGDEGYGVEYPAASPGVTAVGGTSLKKSVGSRGWTESVWETSASEGTGSGCSTLEPKPSWQQDAGCANRTLADVSAVADPATGVAVYDSYLSGGWNVYGGTSVSSPIIASVYALAGTPTAGSNPASFPYAHPASLNDVTKGSNGSCGGGYLCTAGSGYDGPTGLGTPNGTAAFAG